MKGMSTTRFGHGCLAVALRISEIRIAVQQRRKINLIKKVKNKEISAFQMKYYEENSAAMSEDDDNVDIESDVSVFRL